MMTTRTVYQDLETLLRKYSEILMFPKMCFLLCMAPMQHGKVTRSDYACREFLETVTFPAVLLSFLGNIVADIEFPLDDIPQLNF